MHRPVRSGVGHVEKHWLIRRLFRVFLKKHHRVVADGVGVIVGLGLIFLVIHRRDKAVCTAQGGRIIETTRANDGAVKFFKAALQRPVVLGTLRLRVLGHVPLAAHVAPVTARAQCLSNTHHIPTQFTTITGQLAVPGHQANAGLMRVHAREQRRPRRATARHVVKLRKSNPICRQPIKRRCLDLAPVTTDIRKTHVIGHDQDNIWLLSSGMK